MRVNIKFSTSFKQLSDPQDETNFVQNPLQQPKYQLENSIIESHHHTSSKDEMENLQLIEILRLEKEKDYILRMSQIIDTFQLSPINLTIGHSTKQTLIKSIVYQNQDIKETDILLTKHYEAISYKSKLYGISSIILKKYPSSNFIEDLFDMVAFSHKGHILCTFHNFKKIDRLAKAVQTRFRRLSTIFYVQNVSDPDLMIDFFFEMKKSLKAKVIGVYQHSIPDYEHPMKQQSIEKTLILPQTSINGQPKTHKQFNSFCHYHSIIILQKQFNTYQNQLCANYCLQMCNKTKQKQHFDNFILQHICYGDKKRQQYRMRNEITIRLINYCYNKIFCQENATIEMVKEVMERLIEEIEIIRIKLKKSDQVNKSILIYKHFPRLMIKGARMCFHCKRKTKYLCIGCSVRHSTKVALCVLCFAPFHEEKTYYEHFPRIIKKSNCKFIPNLEKQVDSGYKRNESTQIKANKRKDLELQQSEKMESEKTDGVNKEQIVQKIKSQSKLIIKKYKRSKKFVFSCYKKGNLNKKQLKQQEVQQCKMQTQ